MQDLGDGFELEEEWYVLDNFAKDMHVILMQETKGMQGDVYRRPPYPATWARMHGKGRVFYTSMGHREDVWTNPIFQRSFSAGFPGPWAAPTPTSRPISLTLCRTERKPPMKNIRISRRNLLKGAAVAAPYVITSTALGNAETPPASERVTLGHIGVGSRGGVGQLFGHFQQCKVAQSVAVADVYKDRREAHARMIRGKAYADFRDLLARNDIDAVVVATPDHWHVPIAIAAARAKKDAYVEKPLGVSVEQDLACLRVFTENRRVFQYGTQQRNMPHCRFGCELVRSGKIGKVHTIEVIAPNGGAGGSTQVIPVPSNLDYEMWCGPSPRKPFTADRCHPPGTYWIYDYSIGYLGGWGAHPLDIMILGSDADIAGPIDRRGDGHHSHRRAFTTPSTTGT